MLTIHKYRIDPKVEMPQGAKILHIAYQNVGAYLWAEVDTDKAFEFRTFDWIGTGWDLNELSSYRKYIGTLHDSHGFVWHYYEIL